VDVTRPVSAERSDALGVLRQHWWLVLAATLVAIAAAAGYTGTRQPVYESATSVLVQPAGHDTTVAGGRTRDDVNLDTEAQLVVSTAVAALAAETIKDHSGWPGELSRRVDVQVPPNTSILVIKFSGTTPGAAQAGSRAFAEAYLRNRKETARAERDAQARAITDKIEELNASLSETNNRLAAATAGGPQQTNLASQQSTLLNQLTVLTSRLDELTTATPAVGRIISEPDLPSRPSEPDPVLNLASGAALGLVLGLGLAGMAEGLGRRVRRPTEVTRRGGVPVLADLTGRHAREGEEISPPHAEVGRAIDRLRNDALTCLGPEGRVILVSAVTDGPATGQVAANLAASLARAGNDVVLVSAGEPNPAGAAGPLTRLLGVAPAPGLAEVLDGRIPLGAAVQRAPHHPRLRVVAMGTTASASGLLQSQALRSVLQALRAQTGYVVLAAPPTTASADAQSLARLADLAVIVVELRRARHAAVADAADQLRRVGTPLLGAVVVPPGRRHPEATEPAGAAAGPAARPPRSRTDAAAEGQSATGRPQWSGDTTPRRTLPAPGNGRPATAAQTTAQNQPPLHARTTAQAGPGRVTRRPPPLPDGPDTEIMPRLDEETIAALDREHGHDGAAG
jgi:Mrp family chromosome partitioning ATPase/capsular polysaccharide biosynthesis protein